MRRFKDAATFVLATTSDITTVHFCIAVSSGRRKTTIWMLFAGKKPSEVLAYVPGSHYCTAYVERIHCWLQVRQSIGRFIHIAARENSERSIANPLYTRSKHLSISGVRNGTE